MSDQSTLPFDAGGNGVGRPVQHGSHKICTRCGTRKPVDDYNKNAKHPDGIRRECRACQAKQTVIDSENRRSRVRYHKFKIIYNCLTSAQKKIYAATPISEEWDSTKIKAEMARTAGSAMESRMLMGGLTGLVAAGLVKERAKGVFQRVPVDQKQAEFIEREDDQNKDTPEEIMQTTPPELAQSPIDKISALSNQCRALMGMLTQLVSDVETTAIEVQEMFSERDSEVQKLKQLQQLLKSLN